MQNRSNVSLVAEVKGTNCAFCQHSEITHVLKETANFRLAADHAPLVEGHLLIIPKQHYTCYGDVRAEFDAELAALKQEVQAFFARYYAPAVFWEHGVFRQTVFHAHLHCFPFGETSYDLESEWHSLVVHSQEDIRAWHATRGHYFYMEDTRAALLFPPEMERYLHVVRHVLWHGMSARTGEHQWRSPQQRHEEGAPLIEAMVARWQDFQQQGVNYANETSPR